MNALRYLPNVSTLIVDADRCMGCGMCVIVCPHGVFQQTGNKAEVIDLDGCMECGACAANCPVNAVSVNPGVGCASYIIKVWLNGGDREGIDCC